MFFKKTVLANGVEYAFRLSGLVWYGLIVIMVVTVILAKLIPDYRLLFMWILFVPALVIVVSGFEGWQIMARLNWKVGHEGGKIVFDTSGSKYAGGTTYISTMHGLKMAMFTPGTRIRWEK